MRTVASRYTHRRNALARAREQAERPSPPVRAAARLRMARVESATDPIQARATLPSALDEIPTLAGRERQDLFDLAQQIAARRCARAHCRDALRP